MAFTYCQYVLQPNAHPVHREYHDTEYGFPIFDDDLLFERLMLEINQAGLSWELIHKKKEGFRAAYDGFKIDLVAEYGESDILWLLDDPGIIRNRLKIQAAINNARTLLELKGEYGSFLNWLDHHHPLDLDGWKRLFKKTLKFTGGEIVNEFLMSTGYLPNAHDSDCPIFSKISVLSPAWMRVAGN